MIERFFNWLMRNKMLIFLTLVASMVSLSGFNLWASRYDEFAPITKLGEIKGQLPYKATLGKQGENLVVELKWNKFQNDKKVPVEKRTGFVGLFNAEKQDRGNQSVEEFLKASYGTYLSELFRYQEPVSEDIKYVPTFGVSKYPEVKKMKINGSPVNKVIELTDEQGQNWYVWYFEWLELKKEGNTIEFAK